MAYAVGHVSGGHFNCAVTIGLWAGGRFKATDVLPYILTQVAGAIAAAAVLYLIASANPNGFPVGLRPTATAISAPENTVWCRAS
jgi:aquaporin Z